MGGGAADVGGHARPKGRCERLGGGIRLGDVGSTRHADDDLRQLHPSDRPGLGALGLLRPLHGAVREPDGGRDSPRDGRGAGGRPLVARCGGDGASA